MSDLHDRGGQENVAGDEAADGANVAEPMAAAASTAVAVTARDGGRSAAAAAMHIDHPAVKALLQAAGITKVSLPSVFRNWRYSFDVGLLVYCRTFRIVQRSSLHRSESLYLGPKSYFAKFRDLDFNRILVTSALRS